MSLVSANWEPILVVLKQSYTILLPMVCIVFVLFFTQLFFKGVLNKEPELKTPDNPKVPTPNAPPQVQQPGVRPLGPPQVQQPGLRPLGPPLQPGEEPVLLPMPPYPHQSNK